MKYFVSRLAPQSCSINVMIPSQADHDSYNPTPSQMASLANSDAYIAFGPLEFEVTWHDRFLSAAPNLRWFDVSHGVDLISGHHGVDGPIMADPHFWLSPKQLPTACSNIATALKQLYPADSLAIDSSLIVLLDEVEALDVRLDSLAAERPGHAFVIFHPALSYVARDYHFRQLSMASEGVAPQPNRMTEIIEEGKEAGVEVVFLQRGYTPDKVQSVAAALNANIVILQPEDERWPITMGAIIDALK